MVQKIIKKLLKKRHFWRYVGFDELSELYASEFLRVLALSVIGVFVPIYLYKLGYGLSSIFAMQLVWAASRPIFNYISAKSIALFGPKHTMVLGTVSQIVYLVLLVTIESLNWPLVLIGLVGSLSYALFIIALHVDFSKVKHTEHGGKEISFFTICGKVGASIGPLVGGLIASFINPQVTIVVAIVILAGSLVPLFKSAEPTKTKQKIYIKGFPWRRHKRDFVSSMFIGVENIVSVFVWPLFITIVVFKNNTYAAIGLLVSISTTIALVAFYLIGKLIDDQKGGLLLKVGVILNSIVHLLRPFVNTPAQAIGVGVVNEPISASYQMPYNKGLYDAADSVPGYRIVYLTIFDGFRMLGLFIFWLGAYIASLYINNDALLLKSLFVVGAIASLGILFQKFTALKD